MGVAANEQRTGYLLRRAVLDDSLGDGQDMGFVECAVQTGAPMARSAERHLLGGVGDVRADVEVGPSKRFQVNELLWKRV